MASSKQVQLRAEKRRALLAARKAAKALKKRYRHNQRMYLQRKKEKVALIRGEREAYQESTRAFNALCVELRIVTESLRHARKEVEADKALPRQVREALIYAKAFNEGRAMEKQAQKETT